jgi:hypothetical protein
MKIQLADIQGQLKASAERFEASVASARTRIEGLGRARLQAVRRLADSSKASVDRLQGEVVKVRQEAETRLRTLVETGRSVLGTTALERLRTLPLAAKVEALVARFARKEAVEKQSEKDAA